MANPKCCACGVLIRVNAHVQCHNCAIQVANVLRHQAMAPEERAVLEAAEKHFSARRIWPMRETQEEHIDRAIKEHEAWPTNLDCSLHVAVARMLKARREKT